MTINTWFNLIGASIIAAGGLTSNATVFVVAAMLVSPIMGPILGMTFGLRVADWRLFKMSVWNEIKMASTAFSCGALAGIFLGVWGKSTYSWPTSVMMETGRSFSLVISIVVSAAAGSVLAVTITAGGVNSLVGTAISAGLLPPIVNAGMLVAYSGLYADPYNAPLLFSMGMYALIYYATHVVTIVFVANFVFWLKEINPKFKASEDNNYAELPSLQAYNKRLDEKKKAGAHSFLTQGLGATAGFMFDNMKNEYEGLKEDIQAKGGFAKAVQGAVTDTVTSTVQGATTLVKDTVGVVGNVVTGTATLIGSGLTEISNQVQGRGGNGYQPTESDIEMADNPNKSRMKTVIFNGEEDINDEDVEDIQMSESQAEEVNNPMLE